MNNQTNTNLVIRSSLALALARPPVETARAAVVAVAALNVFHLKIPLRLSSHKCRPGKRRREVRRIRVSLLRAGRTKEPLNNSASLERIPIR